MSELKFIAFLDILGFKEMVLKNSHEKLVKNFNSFIANLHVAIAGAEPYFGDDKNRSPYNFDKAPVNGVLISDSILLWSNSTTNQDFINITKAVQSAIGLLTRSAFPLRGAIVLGEMTDLRKKLSDKTDFSLLSWIGRGIVDAYTLEANQEWVGCIIQQKIIDQVVINNTSKNDKIVDIDKNPLFLKYKVPMKHGKVDDYYVVNWVKSIMPLTSENDLRKNFGYDRSINDWSVERKIRNTVDFIKYVEKEENSN